MTKKIDLHNHTYLCNHAEGSVDDFIKKAIELGINIYGFSDHAPMDFDTKYRMNTSQISSYEDMVLSVKERYKNDIEILLGYEVDFLENHMENEILEKKCDYLIGSVHFINEWGFDNPEFIGGYENQDIDTIWQKYFDAITNLANSRLFDIVGHLDLIKIFKYLPKKDVKEIAHESLKAIKQNEIVVEINAAGLRKPIGEQYPSINLIQKMYDMDIPITFGSDAHRVKEVGFGLDNVIKLAKSVGYKKAAIFKNRMPEMIKI